mgnify:FL=1
MSRGARFFLTCLLLFLPLATQAQYNMRKMMEEGRRTLDQGYYVVAMQIFQRVVSLKPHLYEAWYLSALSKYHLDDFLGADEDCTQAIDLNPYIADIFDLRAMSRIALERYDSAATDYTHALDIDHGNRSYWFNRAYCYYMAGDNQTALSQLNYILKRFGPFAEAQDLARAINTGKKPVRHTTVPISNAYKLTALSQGGWLAKRFPQPAETPSADSSQLQLPMLPATSGKTTRSPFPIKNQTFSP